MKLHDRSVLLHSVGFRYWIRIEDGLCINLLDPLSLLRWQAQHHIPLQTFDIDLQYN